MALPAEAGLSSPLLPLPPHEPTHPAHTTGHATDTTTPPLSTPPHPADVLLQVRLHLDQRMQALLQDLDERCLGPWRCLLLPVPQRQRPALLEAAAAFASEHFPSLAPAPAGLPALACLHNNPSSSQQGGLGGHAVLVELLALLLAHIRKLTQQEACEALRAACQLTHHRCDAAHLAALVSELLAAEAALGLQLLRLAADEGGEGSAAGRAGQAAGSSSAPRGRDCSSKAGLVALAHAAAGRACGAAAEVEIARRDALLLPVPAPQGRSTDLGNALVEEALLQPPLPPAKPKRTSRLAAMQPHPSASK